MRKIFLLMCFCFLWQEQYVNAQCTTVRTPTNVQVQVGPSAGTVGSGLTPTSEMFDVTVAFDIGCAEGRMCDNSLYWYVGFYSQTSPATNGLNVEYGTGAFFGVGCDFTQIVDGGEYAIGNTTGADCLYPKSSTCFSQELAQDEGTNSTFSVGMGEDACGIGSTIAGTEVSFTLPAGLCSGITYDVYVWEMSVDQTNYTSGNANSGINGEVACGNVNILAESTPSVVATVTAPGQINQIDVPILTIDYTVGDQVCATGAPQITSDFTTTPDVTQADACAGVSDIILTNTLSADTDIQLVAAGAGNSGNGLLQLGPNVFELNCRDVFELSYSTPTGCGGTFPYAGSTTTGSAYTYVMANATPYDSRGDFSAWDPALQDPLAPNTFNIPQCADNPSALGCPSNLDGGTQTFPNNYTLAFGPFVDQDGVEQTTGGGGGNPFPVEGANPFNAPNTEIKDFGDGILRQVSTICVRYEDGCNGTKSMTCATFISDASPMEVTANSEVQMSCAGANNGQLIIEGLIGGSSDPLQAGTATDYIFTGSPSPFVQCSPGVWETAADVPPGVYTVTVQDPLAAGCGSACDVELTFVISDKIESTITGFATVCPDQCVNVEAILQENPVLQETLTENIDPNAGSDFFGGALNSCDGTFGTVTVFPLGASLFDLDALSVANNCESGGVFSTIINSGGATDVTISNISIDISGNLNQLSISIGNIGSSVFQESIWFGTVYGGPDGGGAGSLVASLEGNTTFSGTYDGSIAMDFDGVGLSLEDMVLTVQDQSCNNALSTFTLNSISIEVTYNYSCPQTAVICLSGEDILNPGNGGALTWALNTDPGSGDLLDLTADDPDDPAGIGTNGNGEFCAPIGTIAGDYVYSVSGFHTSNATVDDAACGTAQNTCCPIMGQVTVTVLDVPPAPTISLTNGQEFCASDCAVDVEFLPALSATPGGVVLTNYNGGNFEDELFLGLEYTANGSTTGYALEGADAGVSCNTTGGSPGLQTIADLILPGTLFPANNTVDYPGEYRLCFAEGFGDGLNGATFTFTSHCGTPLFSEADFVACSGALCANFEVQPEQLVVTGSGIVQTLDPDGIPNNGDEDYIFDPALANIAAVDGSACNENVINYQITSTCGCMVDESIALFVYPEPVVTNPAPKTVDDCAGEENITFTQAEIEAAIAAGGTNPADVLISFTVTDDTGAPVTITNQTTGATGDITFSGYQTVPPVVVTVVFDDANVYTSTTLDPSDATGVATLACDGNGCSTTFELDFKQCIQKAANDVLVEVCENAVAGDGLINSLAPNCPDPVPCTDRCAPCAAAEPLEILAISETDTGTSTYFASGCCGPGNVGDALNTPNGSLSINPPIPDPCNIPFDCAANFMYSWTLDYAITPAANGSWSNEVSFLVQDGNGVILFGPNTAPLPGTGTNANPITGQITSGGATATPPPGPFTIFIDDGFDDGGANGSVEATFSLNLEYDVPMLPVTPPAPVPVIEWYDGPDTLVANMVFVGSPFDPIANGNVDSSVPGDYLFWSVSTCDYGDDLVCRSDTAQTILRVNPSPPAPTLFDAEACAQDLVDTGGGFVVNVGPAVAGKEYIINGINYTVPAGEATLPVPIPDDNNDMIADVNDYFIGVQCVDEDGCISDPTFVRVQVENCLTPCAYDLIGAADNICQSDVAFTVQVTDNGSIIADPSDPFGDGTVVTWNWTVTYDDGVNPPVTFDPSTAAQNGVSLEAGTNNLVFAMNDGTTFNSPAGTYIVTYFQDGGTPDDAGTPADETEDDCSATDIIVIVESLDACAVPITIPAAACFVADTNANGTADFEDGMTALGTLPTLTPADATIPITNEWTLNGTVVTSGADILALITGPGSYSLQYTVGQDLCQTECTYTLTALDCDCPLDVAGIQTECDNENGEYSVIVTVAGGNATDFSVDAVQTDISSGQFTVTYPQGNGGYSIALTSADGLCNYTLQGAEPECCVLPTATIDNNTTCVGSDGEIDLTGLFSATTTGGGIFILDDGTVINPAQQDGTAIAGADGITATVDGLAEGSTSISGDVLMYIPTNITEETTIDVLYSVGVAGCASLDFATVTLVPQPVVDIDLPSSICLGDTDDLDMTVYIVAPTTGFANATTAWSATGDATIDAATGVLTLTAAGSVTVCYTETYTAMSDGTVCEAQDCEVLAIEANPIAIVNPVTLCADECQVDLTQMLDGTTTTGGIFSEINTTSGFTIAGDVLSCNVGAITAETAIEIQYSVGTPDGCAALSSALITLVPTPVVDIDLPSGICLGETLTLTDYVVAPTTGYDEISWTATSGAIDVLTGVFTPAAVGNVTICYTETVADAAATIECVATDCEVLAITSNDATIIDATVCAGSNGQFDLTSMFVDGTTDLGGVFTADAGTVAGDIFSYDANTATTITATITYTVCNNPATATLTILPSPVVDVDLPSGICLGETINLDEYVVAPTTLVGDTTWTATSGTIAAGVFTPDALGNVTICMTETVADAAGTITCVATDCEVLAITSNDATIIDATVCAGSNGQFDLTSMFVDGTTDLGGVFTADAGTVAGDIFSYDANTATTITATITYTVCNNPATATLTILPSPVADLDLPSSFCVDQTPDLDDYIVDVTTAIGATFTVDNALVTIDGDNVLDLSGITANTNITICYEQTITSGTVTCTDTDCEVVLITLGIPDDLLIDGAETQTYCLDEFLSFETIDLTQYLAPGTGGSGFFTITHSDGTTATFCVGGPSSAGCQDGFIWEVAGAEIGTITVTYTIDINAECPQTDFITIVLIEPATDCLAVPDVICEANTTIDASADWYDASCGDCIKTWGSVVDGGQDQYSIETYTNQAAGTYDPLVFADADPALDCSTFVNTGTATNSVTLPQIPVGAQILSFDFQWDYQPTCNFAEGDIDAASITIAGVEYPLYSNAGGPGENGNDHFGWQSASYAFDQATGMLMLEGIVQDGPNADQANPLSLPTMINPADLANCSTGNLVSYELQSNAANFTIGFEANITWATCVFEAYLHETVDSDGNQIDPIQLPSAGITGGFIDNGDGTWSFDANGLAEFGEVDIVFYELNCGNCPNPQIETVIFVEEVNAATTGGGSVCEDAGLVDLTQYLAEGSDNGGIFTSTDATINGDIIDVTGLSGAINITYTLNDGVTNGCGTAVATLVLTVNAAGDASGLSFDAYYCEGTAVMLPGTGTDAWTINGQTYDGGAMFSTTDLSAASPLQAVYTNGAGDCADTQTYLIIVESSSDVSLAADVAACESGLADALIMNSNGCIDMDQFVTAGVGTWSGAGLAGAIFCPNGGTGDFTFTYTSASSEATCGASESITISITEDVDASFTLDDVICAASAGSVDLPSATMTETITVCASGVEGGEIINPSLVTASGALSTIPTGAIITSATMSYNYIAGGTNPDANGDLDSYSVTIGGTNVLDLNNIDSDSDNHFDYTEAADVTIATGCAVANNVEVSVESNSAYWDACVTVTVEYTTGAYTAAYHETGTDVSATAIEYDAATGAYAFNPAGLCDVGEIDVTYTAFSCACEASSTETVLVLCGADASLVAPTAELCYADDIDLAQFLSATATTGGTWSGTGVQGTTLVPSTVAGSYDVTYTVGDAASNCGSDDMTITIMVGGSQNPAWDAPGTVCLGESYDLASYITGTTGGSFSIDAAGTWSTAGLISVTYTVGSGDCSEGWTEVINVIGDEDATVSGTLETCDSADPIDLSTVLTASPANGTWSGTGIAGGFFNPSNLNGTYTLTYSVGEGACESSATVNVSVAPGPDASWTSPVEVCADMMSFNLNNYVSGDLGGTWSASVPGAVAADGTFIPGAAGASLTTPMVYIQVTYTVAGACTATETEVIAVAYVDSYFTMPASACVGEEVTLTAALAGEWWSASEAVTLTPTATGATFTADAAGAYNVTYSTGGLICHKTYTATITICDAPAAPQVSGEGLEVCAGGELGMITVAGSSPNPLIDGSQYSFFEYYQVSVDGAEPINGSIYYGSEQTFDPMALLGEDFTGTATLEIASVNQCGCTSTAVPIEVTVNPSPEINFVLGCTDPATNLAALEVVGLEEDFQIAVYPEGAELTPMMYNPVNDGLAIVTAGEVYNIAVIDANGCEAVLGGVAAELAVDFEAGISCVDDMGMVEVAINVTDGTGYGSPYEYSYDGGLTYTADASMMLSAVANPTISVRVKDQKGCLSAFQTFTLGDGGQLAPMATCNDSGMVTIDLGYTGSNFEASYEYNGETVTISSTSFDLMVTETGTVAITVTDNSSSAAEGCVLEGSVDVYAELTVTASPDLDGCDAVAATTISVTGGLAPFALTIDGEPAGNISGGSLNDLAAGMHIISIEDAVGCTATTMVDIPDAVVVGTPELVYNTSLSSATSVCGDEALTLTVTGGGDFVWSINGAEVGTGSTYTASYSGATTVSVSAVGANGCTGAALEIPVTYYAPLSATAPVIVCNGDGTYTTTFSISGGNTMQSYFVTSEGITFENGGTVSATLNLGEAFSFDIISPESGCTLNVSGVDECADPQAGEGCNPTLAQGSLDCETGQVTVFVSNAGPNFEVTSITGGATFVESVIDGFGGVQVTFSLDDTNIGSFTMDYMPGGVQCGGALTFDISVDCSNVTAIDLIRFDGEVLDAGNNLFWTTANELNSDFFTLERSEDGNTFKAVGTLAAKGNSSVEVDYNFLDVTAPNGISYYRLLETDNEGVTRIVSQVVELTRTATTFGVVSVYPVPTSNSVTVEFTTANTADVQANIFDVTGKLVEVIDYTTTTGVNEMNINVADYATGTYFVTLIQGNEVTNTKFIKN